MRLLFLFLCLLVANSAWAFEARLETTAQSPSGPRTTLWEVGSTPTGFCLAPQGHDPCLARVSARPQGWTLTLGEQARDLRGEVLFDENAEAPWNLLPTEQLGRREIRVRVLLPGVDLSRAYTLDCVDLPSSQVSEYGITPQDQARYRLARVVRGGNVLAEQVWRVGEDWWLVDLSNGQRTVRSWYAP